MCTLRQRPRPLLSILLALGTPIARLISSVESNVGLADVVKAKRIPKGRNQKSMTNFASLAQSVQSTLILWPKAVIYAEFQVGEPFYWMQALGSGVLRLVKCLCMMCMLVIANIECVKGSDALWHDPCGKIVGTHACTSDMCYLQINKAFRQPTTPLYIQLALGIRIAGLISSVESSVGLADVVKAKRIPKGKNQKSTIDFANHVQSVQSTVIPWRTAATSAEFRVIWIDCSVDPLVIKLGAPVPYFMQTRVIAHVNMTYICAIGWKMQSQLHCWAYIQCLISLQRRRALLQ